jgi:enoyl-CoA hydratase/carnithine racemase
VTLTLDTNVATVTLNRPDNGNRIDAEMAFSLAEACRLISEDDNLCLVVLAAVGDAFSIEGHGDGDDEESAEPVARQIAALKIPVLVALNGNATGPGLELALAGDLRVCVPSARFGFSGLAKGILPQDGGTQRLPGWSVRLGPGTCY